MKASPALLCAVLLCTSVSAHDGLDHVRGVVKVKSDYSFTVETDDKARVTLALTAQTILRKGGKRVPAKELKVDDRVFIEVPPDNAVAVEILIELPRKPEASSSTR
jgi:hypothetical protein